MQCFRALKRCGVGLWKTGGTISCGFACVCVGVTGKIQNLSSAISAHVSVTSNWRVNLLCSSPLCPSPKTFLSLCLGVNLCAIIKTRGFHASLLPHSLLGTRVSCLLPRHPFLPSLLLLTLPDLARGCHFEIGAKYTLPIAQVVGPDC